MQLSIIIVSYNVKYFLEQCLFSVEAAVKNLQTEIFVIDNASPDNTIEFLKPKFSKVIFIENDVNVGFAKANNKALHLAKGKYILYLNPDTIIGENVLINCIDFFERNDKAGAVGVKMIDGSGNFLPESKRAFPSLTATFWKMCRLAKLFPKSALFNKYALGNLNENKTHEVDVLSGAFFMSRKEILLKLNGFDEDYFMYGEDIDLSYRHQQLGYKNYYLGENVIVHFKGESTQKQKPEYVERFYEAMKIFVNKHHKKITAVVLNIAINFTKVVALFKQKQPSKKQQTNFDFFLAGDDEAVLSAEKILSKHHYLVNKINLKNAVTNSTEMNLVFCYGKFSYKEAISFMQKNQNKFVYFWHHTNAESIVGSNFRNTAGEIIQ